MGSQLALARRMFDAYRTDQTGDVWAQLRPAQKDAWLRAVQAAQAGDFPVAGGDGRPLFPGAPGCSLHSKGYHRSCGACGDAARIALERQQSALAALRTEYDEINGAYRRVAAERDELSRNHDELVKELLQNTPESLGDDAAAEAIAVRYVRWLEQRDDHEPRGYVEAAHAERTEWAVAYGGENANDCAGYLVYHDEGEAAEMVQWVTGGFLAVRTVIEPPWVNVPVGLPPYATGERAACTICGTPIEFLTAPHDSWWVHGDHPADGHPAKPTPEAAFAAVQDRDGLPDDTGLTHCRACHGADGDPRGPACGHTYGCPEC